MNAFAPASGALILAAAAAGVLAFLAAAQAQGALLDCLPLAQERDSKLQAYRRQAGSVDEAWERNRQARPPGIPDPFTDPRYVATVLDILAAAQETIGAAQDLIEADDRMMQCLIAEKGR